MNKYLPILMATVAILSVTAPAQEPETLEVTTIDVKAQPSSVTVYRGRAAVTRVERVFLEPGFYDLRFLMLPQTILPETLQARVSDTAKVLEIQYGQLDQTEFSTPETEELDGVIKDLQLRLAQIQGQLKVIKSQEAFLILIGTHSARNANDSAGTAELDLDKVRQEMEFITETQTKIIEQRIDLDQQQRELSLELVVAQKQRQAIAGHMQTMRYAAISIVALHAGECEVTLTYLVSSASWQPGYNIRAAADGSSVEIEYNALLTQHSGEDWNNVDMTLSTAQPSVAANPPTITPWYVDIRKPESTLYARQRTVQSPPVSGRGGGGTFGELESKFAYASADAEISGGGPSVTYHLPRLVTVKTNLQKQQRSRIATIQSPGRFTHVATPLLTEAVYIQGRLTNNSEYQLLPGTASIFAGQDYVGPTHLDAVAPGGSFEAYFGIDHSIRVSRKLLSKKTSKTGLLGGGLKTSYDYRIEIDNGAGKGITLELWDRFPVSRNDQITVDLVDLSHALATDAKYVKTSKPLGLLKWNLIIPTTAQAPKPFVVSYGVRINRAKDIELTGLPQ